jgi:glutathione S-transferase
LKGRCYIAGDRYTVADITAMISVDFMKPAKLAMPDTLTNLKRWHDEVSARPSAKA